MKKLLGLLLLLPLLLAAALWLSLPWSAQYLIERWLTEQGFEAPAFTMRHPSWQRLQIDHLSVSQVGDGRRISLSADNIELQFDPLALLQGQLTELRVEQARLQIAADQSLKGRAEQLQQAGTINLEQFHPQQLFAYAPSRRLVVAQLELSYTAPDQPELRVRGNIDLEPSLLQGRFWSRLGEQRLGYLDFNLNPDYRLQLRLSRAREPVVQTQLQLLPDAGHWRIEMDTRVSAERLLDLLDTLPLALPSELRPLSGELELHTELSLPTQLATDTATLLQLPSEHQLDARLQLPPRSELPGADLNLQAALTWKNAQAQLQIQRNSRLTLALTGRPALPPVSLSGMLQLQPLTGRLSGPLQLQTREPPLQLDTELALDSSLSGSISFNLQPVALPGLLPTARQWLGQSITWPELHQGRLEARGNLGLKQGNWQLSLQPTLSDINLSLDNTHVHNLNIGSRIELQPDGKLSARGNLSLGHTDAGIRIFGPDLTYALTGYGNNRYWLQLTPFSLSALDGIVAVPALGFDPLNPELETRLAVSAFDLTRMLELYPQQGLYGSGVLGGELPIRVKGNQVSIDNGHLLSGAEGGVIRYQPTPEVALMAQQNPGIRLALDALTDLRFELLDLKLDYRPNGDALMQARLKGHNPGWQQGRPVDLNLNIEENLLDLLRTLQLTGRVTDSIDRRFRR